MNKSDQVREFREAFNLPLDKSIRGLTIADKDLHIELLLEEVEELRVALAEPDKVDTIDAIIDIQYVLQGLIEHLGLNNYIKKSFKEVHKSNMSKLEDGLPTYDEKGKVEKGSKYKKPDLKSVIDEVDGLYF
jgi:hypothetical protein